MTTDGSALPTVTPNLLAAIPLPWPDGGGSKEERGRVLVVAGSPDLPGAALLAATAALRAGAGKLQIAAPRSVALSLGIAIPEARVIALDETRTGAIRPGEADRIFDLARHAQAVLIGPGLTEGDETADLTVALLAGTGACPFVIDAAAMMRLADQEAPLAGRAVLTPHAGEMAKMLGLDKAEVEADAPGTARRAAALLGAAVVLKGACSFIAAPDGPAWSCGHGNPGLATSGSGDTLAGIMAGLLARGADPITAALWAVYVHGEAGNRLAASRGPLGFLAREIPDLVPAILADLDPRRF